MRREGKYKNILSNRRENESYLKKLGDTIGEVLVALDVELQFIESGWQCR